MMKKIIGLGAALTCILFSSGAFAQACSANNTRIAPAAPAPGAIATAVAPMGDACVCDGMNQPVNINGGGGAVVDPAVAAYIRTGFMIQCSANTMVRANDSTRSGNAAGPGFAVTGASRRGNQLYSGSTLTGNVAPEPPPAAGGAECTVAGGVRLCVTADVTGGLVANLARGL